MKVLTVANRKGGAGKSTCAAHLAIEAVKCGIKTIVIDMDPQKTLEKWWQKRVDENPYLLETTYIDLPSVLQKLAQKDLDLCIIDTPGDASENAIMGIRVADLVVIPSKPTAPDLTAIGRTISMVEDHKKSFVFVITQGIVRSKATIQAASVLSQFGVVAPALVSNRMSYANAMGIGGSAAELDRQASDEISQVWHFLKDRMFKPELIKKQKIVA